MQSLFGMNNQPRGNNEFTKLPKLRTIKDTIDEIHSIDPDTALTAYFIRTLCKANKIQYKTVGKKILINFDYLLEYLSKGER